MEPPHPPLRHLRVRQGREGPPSLALGGSNPACFYGRPQPSGARPPMGSSQPPAQQEHHTDLWLEATVPESWLHCSLKVTPSWVLSWPWQGPCAR